MTDEHYGAVIASRADEIRRKIKGGTIYGRPVDMESADACLAAAWLLGMEEAPRSRRGFNELREVPL